MKIHDFSNYQNDTVTNTEMGTTKLIIKKVWTPEIDSFIKKLVAEAANKLNWRIVSEKIAETFKVTISRKSICSHYYNKLDPTVKQTPITPQESQQISEWVEIHGHRWAELGRKLNHPANDVKNHYYTRLKKPQNIEPEPSLLFENMIPDVAPLLDDYLNQHSFTSLFEDQNDLF